MTDQRTLDEAEVRRAVEAAISDLPRDVADLYRLTLVDVAQDSANDWIAVIACGASESGISSYDLQRVLEGIQQQAEQTLDDYVTIILDH